jgi:hypothetical protein
MMVEQLMQDEAEAATERKKRLLILVSLLRLRAKLLPPRSGDSVKGKRKNMDHHWMAGDEMLEDDYFKDGVTHGPKTFGAAFE